MTHPKRNRRIGWRRDDEGAALITVVGVGMVLALLMSVLVAVSISGARQATDDEDWNAALSAAYAGIDEYQSQLSDDTSYYRYGNPASSFSAGSTVTAPPIANPAFGLGAGGDWATVEGSGGRAEYRYEVDNSTYFSNGRIRVRSTGKVGEATRTIVADLKQQGFIDFLYFSDYEVQDPAIVGTSAASCFSDSAKTTMRYSWDSRPVGTTCNEIAFGASDVNDGPVHSNDTIRACGAKFNDTVTTADARSPYYSARDSNGTTCTAPTFALTGYPTSTGIIGMPATNSQLKRETRSDLTASDVPRPGCLYTGPTQFTFNSNGTVTIRSPFTKMTRIANAAATSGSTPAECGAISDLQSTGGATITVPDNNVMYVQNVPTITSDVNYWPSTTNPGSFTCVATGSTAVRGWSFGSTGYPLQGSRTSTTEASPSSTSYGCRTGDAFVKGDFNGAATIAAENYVYVVGDIVYVNDDDDILGLVGNNAVWVWNPVNSSDATLLTSSGRRIDAALLSVAHTFAVQNFNKGSARGTLQVNGAIAQKYRGTVGTSSGGSMKTGFAKDYNYDTRFKFTAPPKFLNPVTTTYGVTTWVESAAVFNANGSAR